MVRIFGFGCGRESWWRGRVVTGLREIWVLVVVSVAVGSVEGVVQPLCVVAVGLTE